MRDTCNGVGRCSWWSPLSLTSATVDAPCCSGRFPARRSLRPRRRRPDATTRATTVCHNVLPSPRPAPRSRRPSSRARPIGTRATPHRPRALLRRSGDLVRRRQRRWLTRSGKQRRVLAPSLGRQNIESAGRRRPGLPARSSFTLPQLVHPRLGGDIVDDQRQPSRGVDAGINQLTDKHAERSALGGLHHQENLIFGQLVIPGALSQKS